MADYKDYIVRYDIQANVTQAAEGLRAIADIAKQFEAPMQTLSKAITQVSQAAFQLKQNSQITFAPKIDVTGFNNQLRKMVIDVRAAATEMHTALFQALSGNPAATAAMKKGTGSALSSPKNIAQIKRDIESYERELDKIYGTRKKNRKGETIRNRDGSIFYAKKANMHDRVAELEGQGKAIRQRITQLKSDMAALEKFEKDAAAAATKSSSTKKATAVSKSQPAPLTNVTPAVIRQWKDAFGDAHLKNLTINIRGNANGPKGAMTVIEQVLTSLKALQQQASFTINPLLNPEGFAAAEAQLRSLAGLSAKVVAPFGGQAGNGGTKIKGKGKGGKTGATTKTTGATAKPLAIDVVGNITSINPPKTELIVPVVGEIIKLQSKVAEAIPVNAKIAAGSITASLKDIKRPTIPANIKLIWEKGAVGRQAQLKSISEKIPPIKLVLDTAPAVTKLEEFITLIKTNSPQNIALTVTGNAKNGSAAAGTGKGTRGHQAAPLTPREYRDNIGKHLAKGFSLPANYATQITDQQRIRAWHLDQMRRDATAAFATPTPFEEKENVAASKAAKVQRIAASKQSILHHQRQTQRLAAQFRNAVIPLVSSESQLNTVLKHRKYFRGAIVSTGIMPTVGMEAPQMLKYLQGVSIQMKQASVAVPWQLQSTINRLQSEIAKGEISSRPSSSRSMVPVSMQQKPFFDRARKWAYPFTGQTSFGVRTPMAVDMAKGMGVMFAIGGAMSAIGSSFSQAMEYQNTMRTTQAILQNGTESYSQGAFRNMEATVRNVGVKTKFSAPEVANAARFLAMAGYDIDAINASIRPIADLALIGDSDLGETADKMTNIMTTFGIKPGQMRGAANIMATTATRSNTDLMMLAESAKYGGGVANMYGRNDPNLFADTMALFGVMGNAGIQASSAGTALRMMYQNIFKPNKNQRKVLDMMKSQYGISTLNADGSYRAMSSILTEMAQRIPENKMAEIVGNLFRITAQPGAAATLMAAAGGDKGVAEEIGVGIEAMSSKMSSKAGLSSLVSLMLANRESIYGNISGAIAEEKQNTISGLLAQVTSTFTEGIVQAFEQRQGGFEGMLKGLRDYLAKPETIQMLQNLLDMVIEIGKVMAWFIKIWANLYNMCPGLIKFWVVAQMAFTQIGTLIAPFISLIGVFNRLGGVLARLAGVSTLATATTSRAVAGAAGASALNAPFMVGTGRFGRANVIRGNAAVRANRAIANNAILASELALSGADVAATRTALNAETRQHYAAVQARAKRMYGWARVGRAFKGGLNATLTAASFAPVFGGISKLFMGLMTGLAKVLGFICNPATLAVTAIAGVGYGLYKLYQFANGNTEAQILAQQRMAKASDDATRAMSANYSWFTEQIDKWKHPSTLVEVTPKSETQVKLEEQNTKFKEENADIIADLTKDASYKAIDANIQSWRDRVHNNPLVRFAIGKQYDQWVGDGLSENNSQLSYKGTDADFGVAIYNLLFGAKNHAKEVQGKRIQAAIRAAGAGDPAILEASNKITELRQKYLDKSITQNEYLLQARAVRDNIVSKASLSDPTLKTSVGMSLEDFNNISDLSVFREYQIGRYNVLTSLINGAEGSIVGKMNAYYNLQNGIKAYSDEWWSAIRQVIGDFPVTMQVITEQGVKTAENIIVNMMPGGKTIDYNSVIMQVTNKVGQFHKNLQDFANMVVTVYQKLAEAGYITQTEADNLTWGSIEHQHLTKETLVDYYHTLPESHPWKKAHKTADEYANFVGSQNATVQFGGHTWQSARERVYIRRQLAKRAKNKVVAAGQEMQDKATQLTGNNPSGINTPPPKTNPTGTPLPAPAGGTQDAYASHYDKSSARPTVVNININELAHFDRTSVASSSQERDLMAAMEEKIAESIYRLSMTAFNNVSHYMT